MSICDRDSRLRSSTKLNGVAQFWARIMDSSHRLTTSPQRYGSRHFVGTPLLSSIGVEASASANTNSTLNKTLIRHGSDPSKRPTSCIPFSTVLNHCNLARIALRHPDHAPKELNPTESERAMPHSRVLKCRQRNMYHNDYRQPSVNLFTTHKWGALCNPPFGSVGLVPQTLPVPPRALCDPLRGVASSECSRL